uniref:G-protein coupled receptors family 1 profile domain-containing protein n=1 Tax=Gasterosteus aculeatus TaxID=69293 RepID=G3PW82_GASAC
MEMTDGAVEDGPSSFNQSSVTNGSTCVPVDRSADIFFMAVHGLVFLVGLPLNGFILAFFFCRGHRRAPGSLAVYLKNLAVADFWLCLCLPLRMANYNRRYATIHLLNCNLGASVLFLNVYASIVFTGYIAIIRYLKVVQPLGTHILQRVMASHLVSTVTWGFLLGVTSAFTSSFLKQKSSPSSNLVECQGLSSVLYEIVYACSTILFLTVLVFLLFCYYNISRRVSLAQRGQPPSSCSTKLAKSRRKMLALVSVFCFCFVPYHLLLLPKHYLWSCSWGKFFYYATEISIMMSVLNVCLDPLIYFYLCKRFR